jgi:hypothetical protein
MDIDQLWPRDEQHRYRIYRLGKDGQEVMAATPTKAGVGVAICALSEEGEFAPDYRTGVLDVLARGPGRPGRWVVSPYATGR